MDVLMDRMYYVKTLKKQIFKEKKLLTHFTGLLWRVKICAKNWNNLLQYSTIISGKMFSEENVTNRKID